MARTLLGFIITHDEAFVIQNGIKKKSLHQKNIGARKGHLNDIAHLFFM